MPSSLLPVTVKERPLWAALVLMAVARIVLSAGYGVGFEVSDTLWQLLDPVVLRDAPLQSLLFLHAQPPLFNALYAVALQLPAGLVALFLHAIYTLASFAMAILVHFFLRRFGYGPVGAAIGAAAFGLLPQVLVYESTFLYAQLEAVLVLAATYCAARYLSDRPPGSFVAYAACLAALALVRSLFHLGWVAVALFAVWWLGRRDAGSRKTLAVAIAALAVVTAVYAKNFVVFGFFSPSSWQGLNTVTMTLPVRAGDAGAFPAVATDFRTQLAEGHFSPAAAQAFAATNFWSGWTTPAKGCVAGEPTVPALCAVSKANGAPNFNNVAIIAYSKALGADALQAVRRYPAFYARRVASSLMTFFGTPSWSYAKPAAALQAYGDLWDRLMLFNPNGAFSPERAHDAGLKLLLTRFLSASLPLCIFVAGGIAAIFVLGTREAIACWRGRAERADWIFPLLVVALFLVLPNLINGGEADRIRYSIEPVLLLAWAQLAMMFLRGKRA